ncbi:hypothetical protein ACHAXR_010269 [Thalassiosira sp. AJA248-18]
MIQIPPSFPGLAGQIITAIQLLIATTSFSSETNPKTRAQYSKFSQANVVTSATWPSRIGMMVIYTPACFVSVALLALGLQGMNLPGAMAVPLPSVAAAFCSIHFAKRCLEVLFLHKYSGRTDRGTPIAISVYYTLISVLVAYGAGRKEIEHDTTITTMAIGAILFATGIVGNFYHHYLLAKLRSASNEDAKRKYVAPSGGLFSYVATPHYLFELIGWLGIAILSNQMNVYLVFAGMSSYLGGRSVAQNDFNRRKFDEKDWPNDRKNLIPFIF